MAMLMIAMVVNIGNQWAQGNWWAISNGMVAVLFAAGFFGRTMGLNVRDVDPNRYEVWLKQSKILDAKVVMLLSHHSIFLVEGQVVVVPADEITRIVSKSELRPRG